MNDSNPDSLPTSGAPREPLSHADQTTAQGVRVQVRLPERKAWLTYVLLGVTIAMYLMQLASESLLGYDLPGVYGMKINEAIILGQVWRLLTPVFLHGSIMHIGFNMYALYIFGRGLEKRYGTARFAMLYFMGALAGNTLSFLLSSNPSLGASTAIFGLAAAEGVFIYTNRQFFGRAGRSMLMNILTILGVNLLLGLSPGIDNWGHLGGLVGGAIFAWFAGPVYKIVGTWPDLRLVERQLGGFVIGTLLVESLFWLLMAAAGIFL